jgi:dihydrofolate reductase
MIGAVFAVDDTGGIGRNGNIPWPYNKQDMQWFKHATTNSVVVMGKRSWNSPDMVKPLPNRINCVVTNQFLDRPDVEQFKGNVCEGILRLYEKYQDRNLFVIGGADILIQAKPVLDCVYVTRIPGEYMCDTHIDLSTFLTDFKLSNTQDLESCTVELYERI